MILMAAFLAAAVAAFCASYGVTTHLNTVRALRLARDRAAYYESSNRSLVQAVGDLQEVNRGLVTELRQLTAQQAQQAVRAYRSASSLQLH